MFVFVELHNYNSQHEIPDIYIQITYYRLTIIINEGLCYTTTPPCQLQCIEHYFQFIQKTTLGLLYIKIALYSVRKNPKVKYSIYTMSRKIYILPFVYKTNKQQWTNEQNIPFILHFGDSKKNKK